MISWVFHHVEPAMLIVIQWVSTGSWGFDPAQMLRFSLQDMWLSQQTYWFDQQR